MSDRKWRVQLSDDGELPELIEHEAGEPLYCTQCGALNPSQARFCHKCGYSLEEQAADVAGLPALVQAKRKKAKSAERRHNAFASTLLQIVSMASLIGLGAAALVTNQSAALISVMLAWFLTEVVRQSSDKGVTVERALVGIFTVLLVTGLGVTALVMGQGSALIFLMIGWFLVEIVRANS
ncbi:MAG: zinc ribbon domain-containing protein [Chloroflexi bacterium]|jgi:ribosomal protein L40E|nr:zinc ribbon domain-containing protein [Chloroflexota bacterium]